MREQLAIYVEHFGPRPSRAQVTALDSDRVILRLEWGPRTATIDEMTQNEANDVITELFGDNPDLIHAHKSRGDT